ncbi:hypothetical protein WCE39_08000 [Luteimonas sp. MJ174]|uniref:hypothetical protein n=1 Tax=Luteimonas sp. MJ174 TaxID=3129237 RepID=UPI0031B9F09F
MTTRIRVTLTDTATPVTPVEVIDLRDNAVAATLRAAGDVFEDSIYGPKQFLVAEESAGRAEADRTADSRDPVQEVAASLVGSLCRRMGIEVPVDVMACLDEDMRCQYETAARDAIEVYRTVTVRGRVSYPQTRPAC